MASNKSSNSNKIMVPQARAAMNKFKMEAANEVGVDLKKGYNGSLTTKEAGSVGGQMVKKMATIRTANYTRIDRTAIGHAVKKVQEVIFLLFRSVVELCQDVLHLLRHGKPQVRRILQKAETFDGVKDTAKRTHPNGFDHMLAVMEQAVNAPVNNYLLSSSPYWISGKIKKGVCHHLVNDGKLVWVKRRQKK